jgi:protein TonB
LNAYLSKNIKYPKQANENGVQGRVVLQFVVNEDGDISDIKVVRGIGSGCDQEAMRVVNSMPKWKPGKQNGKAVKVSFSLPILFELEE